MTPRHIIPTPSHNIDGDAVMDQIEAELRAADEQETFTFRWYPGELYIPPPRRTEWPVKIDPSPARPDDKPHVFFPLLTFAFGLWALVVVCAAALADLIATAERTPHDR